MYLRDTISISKINAAFLTGQQINRIHVQQLLLTLFVCKPHNTQRLLLYHEPSNSSIDPYAKKEPDFSWDVPIDILKSVPPGRAACIGKCRTKGFGALPNKHFATQKVFLYRRKHCLLSKPYLLFLPLLILQSGKGKMAVSAKKNRKRPRLNLHSWCDPSWLWLHKEYKLTFPGWCCKLLLALANHKEGAHT